jgi:intracellular sulfur oxidation DsrE/DsrF family protein
MNHAKTPSPRRSFLTRLASAVAAFGVGAATPTAVMAEPGLGALAQDEPWMKRLTAAQRVIFHSHEPTNGQALTWARTYLEAQKTAYGKRDDESNVLVGLNGKSIGLVFNDALWAKYPIAQTLGMSGTSNPNGPTGSNAVAQLQSRGVIILVCQNSLRASGQRFLPEPQRNDAAARTAFADEARANLLPGIEIVPAMVATLQMAQDRGCRYIYAGG